MLLAIWGWTLAVRQPCVLAHRKDYCSWSVRDLSTQKVLTVAVRLQHSWRVISTALMKEALGL